MLAVAILPIGTGRLLIIFIYYVMFVEWSWKIDFLLSAHFCTSVYLVWCFDLCLHSSLNLLCSQILSCFFVTSSLPSDCDINLLLLQWTTVHRRGGSLFLHNRERMCLIRQHYLTKHLFLYLFLFKFLLSSHQSGRSYSPASREATAPQISTTGPTDRLNTEYSTTPMTRYSSLLQRDEDSV